MHGEILSFKVEGDGQHIIMTCSDPPGAPNITVRVTKAQLTTMQEASPFWSDGPPQTPTQPRQEN